MEIKDSLGTIGEAYDLVTTKENALDILSGRKKVEFRKRNSFYDGVFLTEESLESEDAEWRFKPILSVHFHDIANTWYLDVALIKGAIYIMHPKEKRTMELLRKYDIHEMDGILTKAKSLPEDSDDVEMYFSLIIDGYYSTNLNIKELNKTIDKVNFDDYSVGDKDGHFVMPVDDIFTITGQGLVLNGCIESGTINVGDEIIISNNDGLRATICAILAFKKTLSSATVGNSVGLLLKGIKYKDLKNTDYLVVEGVEHDDPEPDDSKTKNNITAPMALKPVVNEILEETELNKPKRKNESSNNTIDSPKSKHMVKIKDKNGKSVEAFDIIMHRKVAMDILRGKQKIIFRFATILNTLKFETGLHTNEFKDIDYVRLHNSENTWFLDVRLDDIGRVFLHHDSEKFFHDYNDHTLDFFFDMTRSANEKREKCMMVYVMPIAEILKTNLK